MPRIRASHRNSHREAEAIAAANKNAFSRLSNLRGVILFIVAAAMGPTTAATLFAAIFLDGVLLYQLPSAADVPGLAASPAEAVSMASSGRAVRCDSYRHFCLAAALFGLVLLDTGDVLYATTRDGMFALSQIALAAAAELPWIMAGVASLPCLLWLTGWRSGDAPS